MCPPRRWRSLSMKSFAGEEQGVLDFRSSELRPHRSEMLRPIRCTGPTTPGALANGTGKATVKTGGTTWFFLTADYAFGHALERDTAAVVEANGGKVLGKVASPAEYQRLLIFSSSGARLFGQGHRPRQRGRRHHQRNQASGRVRHCSGRTKPRWPPCLYSTTLHALGLPTVQGLLLTEAFYLGSRRWIGAFEASPSNSHRNTKAICPAWYRLGIYAAVLHYLKAVEALKSRCRWQSGRQQR